MRKVVFILLLLFLTGRKNETAHSLPDDIAFLTIKGPGLSYYQLDEAERVDIDITVLLEKEEDITVFAKAIERASRFDGAVPGIGEDFTLVFLAENESEKTYFMWLDEEKDNGAVEHDGKRFMLTEEDAKKVEEVLTKNIVENE
ncbi:hypothetical protein BTO30_09530 [Domibacillus antri]|uniref:YhfM-like domain-containing protein n=1 Tax=Domibacillus antri TaxID=1714264 RepID=A0A1Q8Q5H0_9BACI|nr:hypothetical protein [Domibacillus antri]OLN22535.1 hypothetical protein BTO30_09530 [Domibacillus antri]